ncbi:MAG: Eco29kI family restriction endonuclease, partial [Selenomonadaceae bacterium]|nr:Eco29kI family restriction endonuclease [Selenomonadaceae bacterium]
MKNSNESFITLEPYNPLDKRRIGEQVATALLAQPIKNLPPEKFIGAGVYALYYTGDLPSYSLLASRNKNEQYLLPIYVGKAVPEG